MRKLVTKLKGDKGNKVVDNTRQPHPNGGGALLRDEELTNSKFTVLDPVSQPPRPPPDQDTRSKSVEGQDVVGTFSGFSSWMASFEPDPSARGVTEISAQPVEEIPVVDATLSMEGYWPNHYLIRLTLTGVKKPEAPGSSFAVTIIGPWFMTLGKVNNLLANYGYEPMVSAKHGTRAASNWSAEKALPADYEIPVVDGSSYYDFEAAGFGPLIGKDDQVGVFLEELRQLRVRCREDQVVVTSFPAELEIGFNRTLRLPEDGKVHNQSVRLGRIPVSNIAGLTKKLESSQNQSLVDVARKGGVFCPLYQREAMFLSFKAHQDAFAVRVFVGGVNAVSGLPWNQRPSATQDYLSVPPQRYLDGVSVGRDIVKQFIAMPLGSGYSVEKQVTGKETVGGMQLEIIPGDGWVLQVPASPHMAQEGPYTPDRTDTPRMTGASIMILVKKAPIGLDNTDKLGGDDHSAKENQPAPVLMHHLYLSQNSPSPTGYGQFRYGQSPDDDEFHAGGTVQMKAVYMLNLKLSYWNSEDGMYRVREVQWAPWWTLAECFAELGKVDFTLNGKSITEFALYRGAQLHPGRGTLEEQGIRDGDTITAQVPTPPAQHGQQGLNYHAGSHNANWFPDQDSTSPYHPEQHYKQQTSYSADDYVAHEIPSDYSPFASQQGAASLSHSYSSSQQAPSYSPFEQFYRASPDYAGWSSSQRDYSHAVPVRPAYPPQSFGIPPEGLVPPAATSPGFISSPGAVSPGSTSYAPGDNRPSASPKSDSRWSSYASPSSPAPTFMSGPSRPLVASLTSSSPTTYLPQTPSTIQGSSDYGSPSQQYPAEQPGLIPQPRREQAGRIPQPRQQKHQDQTGWAMGIAAGTRIRQAIHRDPFTLSTWAKHRATILSVQVLNSVAFESLTGMMAPPSPITAQMYIDKGLPFVASYDEGITTEGQKNLTGIKSVGDIDAIDGAISLGVNAASASKVGCTCCGRMLCDSIIRPCNHAFCSTCIATYMTHGPAVYCRICNTKAAKLIGFSAPMALPGEEKADLSVAKVITTQLGHGAQEFQSIYEMDDGLPGANEMP